MEENTPQIISRKEAKAQGLKRYFTGKPCKHGHVAERIASNGKCLECKRADYTYDSEYQSTYRANNKQQQCELNAAYYIANKEAVKQKSRLWQINNSERKNAKARAWSKAHPEVAANNSATRRHGAAAQYQMLSPTNRRQVLDIYKEMRRLNQEAGYIAYHVDHITPLAKGGAHHPDNLQILSAEENLKKGVKLDLEKVDNF